MKGFKQVDPTTVPVVSISPVAILKTGPSGTDSEQRGFDFFAKCTATSLSGLFPSEFWQKVVLQVGVDLPSLKHAVVAIGSVHESFVNGRRGISDSATTSYDRNFSLKQYNKSVQELQKAMAAGSCSLEVALLCCALYISFDSLRGFTSSAVMHLYNGTKMLQSLQEKENQGEKLKIAGSVTDLRRLMSRLASQINSDMQDPEDPGKDREDTISMLAESFGRMMLMHPLEPATKFTSFEEARDHLYSFINGHLYHYYLRSLYYGSSDASRTQLEAPIETLQQPILEALNSWSSAFDQFMTSKKSTMTSQDVAAASLLQMHYQISYIMIVGQIVPDQKGQTSLNTTEVFAPFNHSFAEALLLIESLIAPQPSTPSSSTTPSTPSTINTGTESSISTPSSTSSNILPYVNMKVPASKSPSKSQTSVHSTFYADCGVVPMLFFIAMKCNDPRLRRKATNLLRVSHRREGTWDSETCLRIVEYNTAKEDSLKHSGRNEHEDLDDHSRRPSDGSSSGEGSPDMTRDIDVEVVLKDERARRYIEAGKEEAARLQRSVHRGGGLVRHSLLYL